jgi:adenylyl cyclase-associated protein
MAMSVEEPNISKNLSGTATAAPATPEPPKPSPPPPAPPAAPQIPPQIQDFDALIKGDVQNFVKLGAKIGGLVEEQVRFTSVGIDLKSD